MVEGAAVLLHREDRELLEVAKAVLRNRFPEVQARLELTLPRRRADHAGLEPPRHSAEQLDGLWAKRGRIYKPV
jgi:hypothetical protein